MAQTIGFIYRQLFVTPAYAPSSISLTGQTAIVTGSNTGLGLEAARQLLGHKPSRLILAVRSIEKGQNARLGLLKKHPEACIDVWLLDMEDPKSVIVFGERAAEISNLKVVILNAGIYQVERTVSPATGVESHIQIHLSTALLSLLLLPTLRKGKTEGSNSDTMSHLTIVTSELAMQAKFEEQNAPNILARLIEEDSFNKGDRYHTSKLLNILWARELAANVSADQVVINTLNPGLCVTQIHRSFTGPERKTIENLKSLFGRTADVGGRTLVYAAIAAGKESHGAYLSENKITQ